MKMKKIMLVSAVLVAVMLSVSLLVPTVLAAQKSIITLSLNIMHTKASDLNTLKDEIVLSRGLTLANGTGANQADTVFHDNRTLADGANETLDLNDGTLSDQFGDAVTLDILKTIYIKNNSSDASLLIGGAAATQLGLFADGTDILTLRPGGEFFMTAADANGIDTTTNPDLKMAHNGTGTSSLTYDIIVIGVD